MKIKLGALFNAVGTHQANGPLLKLSKSTLPIAVSFKVGKILNLVQKELEVFDVKRLELVNKYSDEVDGKRKIKEENLEDFKKEFTELCDIEVDIEVEKVKLSLLSNVQMEPFEVSLIEPFIENDL